MAADALLITSRVRLGDLPALTAAVDRIASLTSSGTSSVTTGLPALIAHLTDGFGQAATVERVLTVQLVVLALIAFAVIVAAAAGQRGRELALARLRGQSPLRVAWQFGGEIAGIVALAFVPALALALGLTALAGRWWLGAGATAELLLSVVLAAVAAGIVALATTAVIGWRTSRRPISELLREVPATAPVVGVGALEAGVATLAAAGLYLAFSGNSGTSNGISLLTPMLMAALAGLVVGRLVVAFARTASGWAWRRRRLVLALAAASLGRRTGYRLAASVLCISAALVVFAGQQGSVADGQPVCPRRRRDRRGRGARRQCDEHIEPGRRRPLRRSRRYVRHRRRPAEHLQPGAGGGRRLPLLRPCRRRGAGQENGRATPSSRPCSRTARRRASPSPRRSLTLRLSDLSRRIVGNTALNAALARPLGPVFLELVFVRASGGTTTASFGPLPAAAGVAVADQHGRLRWGLRPARGGPQPRQPRPEPDRGLDRHRRRHDQRRDAPSLAGTAATNGSRPRRPPRWSAPTAAPASS